MATAFGGLKGTLTGSGTSIGASNVTSTGSISVAKGDLIVAVFAEQTALTVTGCTDSLGHTYTPQNAGSLAATTAVSGRMFYQIATIAGTLTTCTFAATSSAHNFSMVVAVYTGGFSAIDKNLINITNDVTTPYNCTATGTLTQPIELIISWATENAANVFTASGSGTVNIQVSDSGSLTRAILASQAVNSTGTVIPGFTGTAPTADVLGSATFSAAPIPSGGSDVNIQQDWPLPPVGAFTRIDEFYSFFRDIPVVPTFKPVVYEWEYPRRVDWYQDWFQQPLPIRPPPAVQDPFKQLDWPLAQRVIWYNFWNQRFDNKTLGINPTNQSDWPNPQRPYWNLFWSQSPYVPVVRPFVQSDWPYPRRVDWYKSQETNLLETPFFKKIPFLQFDWPYPPRVFWNLGQNTRGVDVTTLGINPFNQDEWTVPQRVNWYQDWYQPGLIEHELLLPFNQLYWPVAPRPYWDIFSGKGVDEVTLGINPFNQDDWPLPARPIWYQDWNQNLLEFFPVVVTVPFNQTYWPIAPRAYWDLFIGKGVDETTLGINPFNQDDWPLAVRPYWNNFASSSPDLKTLGTNPFRQQDWVNPLPVSWYRDWAQNTGFLFPAVSTKPFHIDDWPLPLPAQWYQDWTKGRIPQSVPFAQLDWSLPQRREFYRDFTQGRIPQSVPFKQLDWPIPSRVFWNIFSSQSPDLGTLRLNPFTQLEWTNSKQLRWYQDWSQSLVALITPAGAKPFHSDYWPNPNPVAWYQDLNQNLVLLFGPAPPPPPTDLHFKPFHATMGRMGNLGGLS